MGRPRSDRAHRLCPGQPLELLKWWDSSIGPWSGGAQPRPMRSISTCFALASDPQDLLCRSIFSTHVLAASGLRRCLPQPNLFAAVVPFGPDGMRRPTLEGRSRLLLAQC